MSRSADDWGWAAELEDIGGFGGGVAIAGVGESDHSKASGREVADIVGDAVDRALADAGLTPADVDGIMYGPQPPQFDEQAFAARYNTGRDLWVSHEGGGMTWAATAPSVAAGALRRGEATCIVNTFGVAWATQRASMVGGPGQSHAAELHKQNLEVPFGFFPQPVYFATIARRHMYEFGTTEDDLGGVAVACRRHANLTPAAIMHDKTLTLEQYRASAPIVAPLRKEDCSLISDGGGAYIMTTVERARDLARPVVEVAGVGMGYSATGVHWAQQAAFTSTPQVFAAPGAFAMAGLAPADVDVYSCYDPFTIVTVMQIEDSGFCAKGEGGAFCADGGLDYDGGRLPTNTHGGLLSHAYVLGIAHVVELVRQLRGEAAAQVAGAEVGAFGGYAGPHAGTLVLRRAR